MTTHQGYTETSKQAVAVMKASAIEPKIRRYAQALARRTDAGIFDEEDFYQLMNMKILTMGRLVDLAKLTDSYLLKSIWNEGLMAIRKQHRYEMHIESGTWEDHEGSYVEILPSDEPTPEETVLSAENDAEMSAVVKVAIASLPERSRQVCYMLYSGKKPVEVARALHISRGMVVKHTKRIQKYFMLFGLQPS